ncbi:MAG: heavy metal-binding domain-containing protein [Thermoanaerobaculia bacterium]
MHFEYGLADRPGDCPICNMTLVCEHARAEGTGRAVRPTRRRRLPKVRARRRGHRGRAPRRCSRDDPGRRDRGR